jgi:hypothetical protein
MYRHGPTCLIVHAQGVVKMPWYGGPCYWFSCGREGSSFCIHHTAQILFPEIFTSMQPSKMPSVGKGLGMMTSWRNDEVAKIKIKLMQEGDRRSCFSLAQGCWSWSTVRRKMRRVYPSIYPINAFKELYNRLAALKTVLQNLLGNLRILKVQTVCCKTT